MNNKREAQKTWFIRKGQLASARAATRRLCRELHFAYPISLFDRMDARNDLIAKEAGVKVKKDQE